jgi:hypothetical protein
MRTRCLSTIATSCSHRPVRERIRTGHAVDRADRPRVLLSPPGPGEDSYRGVVSNLPDVAAHGPSERECLRQIVLEFKKLLQYHQAEGTPVPWLENRLEPQPGQLERWIPVHL